MIDVVGMRQGRGIIETGLGDGERRFRRYLPFFFIIGYTLCAEKQMTNQQVRSIIEGSKGSNIYEQNMNNSSKGRKKREVRIFC